MVGLVCDGVQPGNKCLVEMEIPLGNHSLANVPLADITRFPKCNSPLDPCIFELRLDFSLFSLSRPTSRTHVEALPESGTGSLFYITDVQTTLKKPTIQLALKKDTERGQQRVKDYKREDK